MSDLRDSLVQSGTLIGYLNTIVYAHNYNDLSNKPQINGVTLQGNKTASELGLVTPATEAVQSVNGETGAVVLDGNDIAYDSTKTINQQIDAVAASIPVMAVTSVNGETGDVVLDGSDIRYDADYTVSAKIAAVEGDIPVVPVQSVNGETGAVVLDGDDIAYNSSLSVNQKIDAVEAAIPVVSYPVTSVNSKTGAVVLDDSDIEHSSGVSVNSIINTMVGYIPVYGNTASGAIATFDTSLALPLQDCTIAINAVQESGTPTPSSPKLISGFTGANIHVADDETPHVIDNVTAISWQSEAGTVYGGSLDVTTGVLTVTHAITTLDGSQGSVSFRTSAKTGYTQTEWYDYRAIGIIGATIISDKFASTDGIPTVLYGVGGSPNGERCFFGLPDTVTTPAEANTWFSNNPTVIVYPIATPVTYQLTPTQISAIVGTNNIFTDTNGNTSVMYACSLKDYIEGQ